MSTFMEHIHRTDVPLFDADAMRLWAPVEFNREREGLADAYRHENGAITYVVYDDDGSHCNPREDNGNLTTLIQRNDRCIAIDTDDAGLQDAYDRFRNSGRGGSVGTTTRMQRYLNIYRSDIVHFCDYWQAGESYGWGYITRAAWEEEHMLPGAPGEKATLEKVEDFLTYTPTLTPADAFAQEVDLYRQWADGEVYGGIHVHPDGTDDSCWGFLGYDNHKDICGEFTDSPITETLY